MRKLMVAVALLSGCGGGEAPDGGVVATSAEGLWQGTMNKTPPSAADARTFSAVVLGDGSLWMLYSVPNTTAKLGAANLGGAIQGIGISNAGIYSVASTSSSRIFGLNGTSPAQLTLAATYTEKSRFDGSINPGAMSFAGLYDLSYNTSPASVATLSSGTFDYLSAKAATLAGPENVNFKIDSLGLINGTTASGCTFNGSLSARTKGGYNVSLSFVDLPSCGVTLRNTRIAGVATYDASRQLNLLVVNSAKTAVFVLIGTRP